MKHIAWIISIFLFTFYYSFSSTSMYETDNEGVPLFSNTSTKGSSKLDLDDVNVVDNSSDNHPPIIINNINVSNKTENNNQQENDVDYNECYQYENDLEYDNSYSYIPYTCRYFFRRHDRKIDDKYQRKDSEEHDIQQQRLMSANKEMSMASPMGMRMGGGRR